ncbi:CHAT domain-containing tetratricopeptide repeat protein [uncultured Hyphomicrobium sp.]|uniref:CHAT domain-containing tetratricopeptide repeat protein n=1 Tax=uncultured Hyphomicrobium sp. TaxID=194373 RepID=UPI0025F4F4CF|nr:CHAT domain-containing tetratricopeptide repeat protein [uncultured Hyphomicrobium sp.]
MFQMVHRAIFLIMRVVLLLLVTAVPSAGEEKFITLFKRVQELSSAGKTAEAAKVGRRLYAAAEKRRDLDPLSRANVYGLVANALWDDRQIEDALALYKREVQALEKAPDAERRYVGVRYANLANAFYDLSRFDDAELPARRSVEFLKTTSKGEPAGAYANASHQHATILRKLDRREEALEAARIAVAMWERADGPESGAVANGLNTLAILLNELHELAEADKTARRALQIRIKEAKGRETLEIAGARFTLANILSAQNRLPEAIVEAKKAFSLQTELKDEGAAANTANSLAIFLKDAGRAGESEFYIQKAIEHFSKDPNPDNEMLVNARNTLVSVLIAQGRETDALPIAREVVESRRRVAGPDHRETGNAENTLSSILTDIGQFEEAERAARETIRIWDLRFGPKSGAAANARNSLTSVLQLRGDLIGAQAVAKDAYEIWLAQDAKEPASSAFGLWRLATISLAMGNAAEAEDQFRKALKGWTDAFGSTYHRTALARSGLVSAYVLQSKWDDSVTECHTLIDASAERTGFGTAELGGKVSGEFLSDMDKTRSDIHRCTKAAFRKGNTDNDNSAYFFKVAQWATNSKAALALAQMAARASKGDEAIAEALRNRQRLVAEGQLLSTELIEIMKAPRSEERAHREREVRTKLLNLQMGKDSIDHRLQLGFPDYAALSAPQPVSIEDLQKNYLRDDEALILFLDTNEQKPVPEETFVWVVTKTDAKWEKSDLGSSRLAREVTALRCGLDPSAWTQSAKKNACAALLGAVSETASTGNAPAPFDFERAHSLFTSLLGRVSEVIAGKSLIIVPSGALTQLPFQVLITAPANDGKSPAWLIRDHAITVLPSVASLKALRGNARAPGAGRKPYLAFANPLLSGDGTPEDESAATLAKLKADCNTVSAVSALHESTADLRQGIRMLGGSQDIAELRRLPPVPQTADLACAVAKSIGASDDDINLGARATEAHLKTLSTSGALAKYAVVNFATHGAVAGELTTQTESGLVLTPPTTPTEDENGYLSASEVTELKLDADWVILSACNTAAGGTANAEALSGLARAFFYAGARSLVVSHWPVRESAAVTLITKAMTATAGDKPLGRAEAMRGAMLALADTGDPKVAHPSYWAPFVVVGEGAAGK